MGQFAYGLSVTLLHSLWQSALLLLIYIITGALIKRQLPSARRNFLYILLITQVCISVFTFSLYVTGSYSLYEPLLISEYVRFFTEQPLMQSISPWLLSIYLFVVSYKMLSLAYNWNSFKQNCTQSLVKPLIDLKLFTIVKANEFGIKRKVSLWYSSNITTPVTFGFFKPVILMPVALLNNLSVEEAESLIVHELTHIKNNDYLLNFILIACDTLFFFNPFIKIIVSNIKLEREKNCDIHVLDYKYSSLSYAETLLKTARFKPVSKPFQLAAVSRQKQLLHRILYFTAEKNLNFRRSEYNPVSYLLILVVFCISLFTVTEIRRDENKKTNHAYIPAMVPGYNSEMMYAMIDEKQMSISTEALIETPSEQSSRKRYVRKKSAPSRKIDASFYVLHESQNIHPEEQYYAVPVMAIEEPEVKEVIVNEESSAGNKITKAYKMFYMDGQWIAEPLWMYTESKLRKDSIQMAKDTIIRPFHIIQ